VLDAMLRPNFKRSEMGGRPNQAGDSTGTG
jgi:hypothetical protein